MEKIRCLYMEDNEADFKLLSSTLKSLLQDVLDLDIVLAHTPVEAMEILKRDANNYQLFIADLMFPIETNSSEKKFQSDGLLAIDEAVSYSHLAIAALSVGERDQPGISLKFKEATNNSGLYIDKDAVRQRQYPREQLKQDLLKLLSSKGYLLSSHNDVNEKTTLPWNEGRDLKLDVIVETIGHKTLAKLAKATAPECEQFILHYVAPGYSGAIVLRLTGYKSKSTAVDSNILLKCSHDKAKLEIELKRSPKQREGSSSIYIPPDSMIIHEQDGWFATAWRFQDDAQTFLSWLEDTSDSRGEKEDDFTNTEVGKLLNNLFIMGLNKDYKRGNLNASISPVESLYPNIRGRFRIVESINKLHPIISRVFSDATFEKTTIAGFLVDKILGGRPINKIKPEVYECICHGDLHTRNILIRIDGQPALIDPARRIERRHWASDIARLCADIWISAWDAGPDSHLWENLHKWKDNINYWLKGTDISPSIQTSNKLNYQTLVWVRENIDNIFHGCFSGPAPIWEFRLALAVELLNLCSYDNIPTPKRCFGVITSKDILDQLHSDIPWT